MESSQLRFLTSPEGRRLLEATAQTPIDSNNHLQIAASMRLQVGPKRAHSVIETVLLRQLAAKKFNRASKMFFTRPALEQASSETISIYRAQRFADAGFTCVADLGCSIGGDALALAAHADVIGIDLDFIRLIMAGQNVLAYGHMERFFPLQADLMELPAIPCQAFFFDPARRDETGKRLKSVELYRPSLTVAEQWLSLVPHAAIKISPGVDYEELPPDAETEFISLYGAVKEAVLWFGDFQSGAKRRATLLPGGYSLSSADYLGQDVKVTEPSAFLYEPDGAVIRAHLVQNLARHIGGTLLDAQIAYLTASQHLETPFARCFEIEAWFPFQLKQLRQYLRSRNVGQITIKKRGSPLEPAYLERQLRLRGDQKRTLFLTHVNDQHTVIIAP